MDGRAFKVVEAAQLAANGRCEFLAVFGATNQQPDGGRFGGPC